MTEKSGVRGQGVKYVWSAGYIKELRGWSTGDTRSTKYEADPKESAWLYQGIRTLF